MYTLPAQRLHPKESKKKHMSRIIPTGTHTETMLFSFVAFSTAPALLHIAHFEAFFTVIAEPTRWCRVS